MTDKEGILQKYIEYKGKYYCPYCGKELKEEEEYDHYNINTYRYCDCEDAKKEREIMRKIKDLQNQLPRINYKLESAITEIKHPY